MRIQQLQFLKKQCDEDWECGEGFYCSSNFCETCVPCEKVFYRQSPSSSCAKSVSNCGDCLNGYTELIIWVISSINKLFFHLNRFQADDWSDQKFFHKCLPVKSSDSSVATSAVSRQSAWSVFFLSLFGWIIISLYWNPFWLKNIKLLIIIHFFCCSWPWKWKNYRF